MFFKRLFRTIVDILDVLGRLDILRQLLTLTKAGQLVLAGLVGVGVFTFAIFRSDPWSSALAFGVLGFAGIAVAVSVIFQLKARPKLEYKGIAGTQFEFGTENFGMEEGGFMYGINVLQPLLIRIVNSQKDVDVAANNVSAKIHYKHFDKRDEATVEGVWIAIIEKRSREFVPKVHIESGETARLIMLFTYPPTRNQEAQGAKRSRDYLAASNLFEGGQSKKFSVGHWRIHVEVKSDNSAPLILKGEFWITKDERIEFSTPALRMIGSWE